LVLCHAVVRDRTEITRTELVRDESTDFAMSEYDRRKVHRFNATIVPGHGPAQYGPGANSGPIIAVRDVLARQSKAK
jgi:hypothetical protein